MMSQWCVVFCVIYLSRLVALFNCWYFHLQTMVTFFRTNRTYFLFCSLNIDRRNFGMKRFSRRKLDQTDANKREFFNGRELLKENGKRHTILSIEYGGLTSTHQQRHDQTNSKIVTESEWVETDLPTKRWASRWNWFSKDLTIIKTK